MVMPSYLTRIFENSVEFQYFQKEFQKDRMVNVSGLTPPLWAALADFVAISNSCPVILVVTEALFSTVYSDCKTASKDRALQFPPWDVLPYEHKYPDSEMVASRIFTLWRYFNETSPVVITTPKALSCRTIPRKELDNHISHIVKGMKISPEEVCHKLSTAGYRREELVEYLESYARRGEIVDFFSPGHRDPVRISFFEDDVEDLRLFSTRDQRSISKIKDAYILPAVEWLTMEKGSPDELMVKLRPDAKRLLTNSELEELSARIALDRHFPGEIWFAQLFEPSPVNPFEFFQIKNPIIIAVEPESLEDESLKFQQKALELFDRISWEEFKPLPPQYIFDYDVIEKISNSKIFIREIPTSQTDVNFSTQRISISSDKVEIFRTMESLSQTGDVFVAISSQNQKNRIAKKIGGAIPVPTRKGIISESFKVKVAKDEITSVISGDELLGFSRALFEPSRYHQGRILLAHYGLEQGDLVVHSDYGISQFLGIETLQLDNRNTEFLLLIFAQSEKLYVPMEDFFKVNPYIGPERLAKLSKLGGRKWSVVKAKTRQKAFELAGELTRIYALREVKKRKPFEPDYELESMLYESFPFDETPDQQRTIQEVLSDMNAEKPMDRLVCGDVGFGKTEVAIRAALRAVASDYQMAVLVPTTILAVQHYETFLERLKDFPVRISMLSRFTRPKDARDIVEKISNGDVDIVIGTHALLSEHVKFKRLGLVIIDEEQWFGVKQKEKLRSLRAEVDVLTLTATPIPRTLYFSISGIRDISIIQTPPIMRRAIFTQVIQWKPELFAKITYQELERGGQVFFVHNRVETIEGIAAILKKEMPDVSIAIAHGQMPERSLERTVLDFRNGKYDMLLSTVIIESGTDMPRVNTIIINRADKLGLSQLYQLRGRVGRSDVQAYAYLVLPPYRNVTVNARKRIRALLEHTDLGSGYHLAMKDLEIRGAGNMLGKEQSGFIAAVGLDLYSKMLAEAVAELKGRKPPIFEPIPFKIDFDAYIPAKYIHNLEQRLWAYQRLFTSDYVERLNTIVTEMVDRFGRLPEPVRHLVKFLEIRILATLAGFDSVVFGKKWVTLNFNTQHLSILTLDKKLKGNQFLPELTLTPKPALRIPRYPETDSTLIALRNALRKLV